MNQRKECEFCNKLKSLKGFDFKNDQYDQHCKTCKRLFKNNKFTKHLCTKCQKVKPMKWFVRKPSKKIPNTCFACKYEQTHSKTKTCTQCNIEKELRKFKFISSLFQIRKEVCMKCEKRNISVNIVKKKKSMRDSHYSNYFSASFSL